MKKPLRRAALAVIALAAVGPAAPGPARAQGSAATDRNLTARDFRDTFGANIHLGEGGYRDTRAVADALRLIGFSRVRFECTTDAEAAAARALAARAGASLPAGLKADVLIIGYLNAPGVTLATQRRTVPQIADLVETIEGPNEINNPLVGDGTHGPFDREDRTRDFARNYRDWATALDAWKRGLPALSRARLLAPTIASGDPGDYAKLPDVSAFVDSGTLHFYAGNGRPPSGFGGGNFSALLDWYKAAAAPAKPVSVSEWGQTTAGRPGQGGCDEATQAKYVLDQMFDIAARGVYRAYLYQLMDDTADGDPTGSEGAEAHFGVFDSRWVAKPAARALATVKSLLSDGATRFTPRVPSYRVSGVTAAGASGSSLSVSKSDGSTVLVVWNEPPVWDPQAAAAVTPVADAVTVDFGGRYAYAVYDPLIGTKAVAGGAGSRVQVTLSGSPLMIRLSPLRETPAPVPAPPSRPAAAFPARRRTRPAPAHRLRPPRIPGPRPAHRRKPQRRPRLAGARRLQGPCPQPHAGAAAVRADPGSRLTRSLHRTKPAGVCIGDSRAALTWAKENLPDAVTETIDRAAVTMALLETGEAVPFAAFTQTEEIFYIK